MTPVFILTAIKSRMPNVRYLVRKIPNLVVVWDEIGLASDTFRRAWRIHQDEPTVRIQDDIVLTKNFMSKILDVINERPTDCITFFSRSKYDRTIGSRYRPGRTWMMNQCYYLPPGAAARLSAFSDAWPKWAANPGGDDLCMQEWMGSEGLQFWNHCPSLVEHLSTVSTIDPRRSRFRQSTTFIDPDLDGAPV